MFRDINFSSANSDLVIEPNDVSRLERSKGEERERRSYDAGHSFESAKHLNRKHRDEKTAINWFIDVF